MRTVLSRHLALISYIGALWTKFSAAQSDGPQFHPANQVLSYAPRVVLLARELGLSTNGGDQCLPKTSSSV
jgi:hypothetical protein